MMMILAHMVGHDRELLEGMSDEVELSLDLEATDEYDIGGMGQHDRDLKASGDGRKPVVLDRKSFLVLETYL